MEFKTMIKKVLNLQEIDKAISNMGNIGDREIESYWHDQRTSLSCYLTHPDSLSLATSLVNNEPWKLDEFLLIGRDFCSANSKELSIKSEDDLRVLLSALLSAGLEEHISVVQDQFALLAEVSQPLNQLNTGLISNNVFLRRLNNTLRPFSLDNNRFEGLSDRVRWSNIGRLGRPNPNEPGTSGIPKWPGIPELPGKPKIDVGIDQDLLNRFASTALAKRICEKGIEWYQVHGVDIPIEQTSSICGGDTVTLWLKTGLKWPIPRGKNTPVLTGVFFNSSEGGIVSVSADNVIITAENSLEVKVPTNAVSGVVYINFEPGPSVKKKCVISWPDPYLFRFTFKGGLTSITRFSNSRPQNYQRSFSAKDNVSVYFYTSNTSSRVLTVEEPGSPPYAIEIEDDQYHVEYVVPHLFECGLVKFTLTVNGPCQSSLSNLKESIEVLCDRSYLPLSNDIKPMYRDIFTSNFYIRDWTSSTFIEPTNSVSVTRPRTITELSDAIRFARRDGYQLAPKSTNSSYERLTPIDGNNSKPEIRLVETHACTDKEGFFTNQGLIGEIQQHDELYNNDFSAEYDRWLTELHIDFSNESAELRKVLRPIDELKSVISDSTIANYEAFSLGASITDDVKMKPLTERLVYIKAGIKLYEINRILDKDDLALPTMGGGAFQSLGGAVATSTHGSNFKLPPLSSFVRAIHMVSDSGQEWWVEPDGDMTVTASIDLSDSSHGIFQNQCLNIVKNSQLFKRLQVNPSLPGIVWAYVIETVPTHYLYKTVNQISWGAGVDAIEELASDGFTSENLWFRAVTFASSGVAWSDEHHMVRESTSIAREAASEDPLENLLSETVLHAYINEMNTLQEQGNYAGLTNSLNQTWGQKFTLRPFGHEIADVRFGRDLVDQTHKAVVNRNFQGCLYKNTMPLKSFKVTAEHSFWLGDTCDLNDENRLYPFEDWDVLQRREESQPESNNFRRLQRRTTSTEIVIPISKFRAFADDLFSVTEKLREEEAAIVYQMNVRVTKRGDAEYAMQRWAQSVHIELWTFDGIANTDTLRDEFDRLANNYGAIRHWGQQIPTNSNTKKLHDPFELSTGADNFKVFGYNLNQVLTG